MKHDMWSCLNLGTGAMATLICFQNKGIFVLIEAIAALHGQKARKTQFPGDSYA